MKKTSVIMCIVVVVTVAMLMTCAKGRLVFVGDQQGWKENADYTAWALQQSLHVGDLIGFQYDKNKYDAIEVNKRGYETCNQELMIRNLTHGAGRDVLQLTEGRQYYFICSKGQFCNGGMKVAITVSKPIVPLPVAVP